MPNAKVLPVPVLAWPIRSWPSSATGRVSAWMGNAVVMPSASSAAQMGSAMPKSRKVFAPHHLGFWLLAGRSLVHAGRKCAQGFRLQ